MCPIHNISSTISRVYDLLSKEFPYFEDIRFKAMEIYFTKTSQRDLKIFHLLVLKKPKYFVYMKNMKKNGYILIETITKMHAPNYEGESAVSS